MDNLMHNTLEEIATHVRTIELPTPAQQPETESFYEDSPPEESLAQDSEGDQPGYYQGRKIRDSYPTPPATPPPAALLARLMAGASLDEKDRQGTPKTAPWAAAFMAGTQAGKVGEYRGVAMDKAAIQLSINSAKLGYFILNNVANNDTAIAVVAEIYDFLPAYRRLRCGPYTLNLIGQTLLWGNN
ncbi:hypothetical protein PtrV1_13063 [Pyrenophora tritici-repentis]|nr:hypothetical protein PtrV1_13063 [Pyrenophora tritici-repentis]